MNDTKTKVDTDYSKAQAKIDAVRTASAAWTAQPPTTPPLPIIPEEVPE